MDITSLMAILHGTMEHFWILSLYGIILNIIGVGIIMFSSFITTLSMDSDEIVLFEKFLDWRKNIVNDYMKNKRVGNILNALSLLFPFHVFVTSIIFSLNVLLRKTTPLIYAVQIQDRLNLCPIKYDIK